MLYNTYEEMIADWGPRADAKLRADNIDPGDLAAVEACLTACCGGQRLFQAWVDWRATRHEDDICKCSRDKLDWQGHCDDCNAEGDRQMMEDMKQ